MLCCINLFSSSPPLSSLLLVTPLSMMFCWEVCVVFARAPNNGTPGRLPDKVSPTRRHTRRPHAGLSDRNTQAAMICLLGFMFSFCILLGIVERVHSMDSTVDTVLCHSCIGGRRGAGVAKLIVDFTMFATLFFAHVPKIEFVLFEIRTGHRDKKAC